MEVIVSIDDTDNLESKGTGELAQEIANYIESNNWGKSFSVTRHQLFVHEDIPYTSHNSSMCFKSNIDNKYLNKLIDFAATFLKKESAEGSDPGLCIAVTDEIVSRKRLIDFGLRAKKIVLHKKEAYKLATDLNIHLSEHGGTGQGVIGALAGVGLRLTGNDGRFKGRHNIKISNGLISVEDICKYEKIDIVKSIEGDILNGDELIILGEKIKTVLLNHEAVLLVYKKNNEDEKWHTCTRQQLRSY